MFAEDADLLPRELFTRLLENGIKSPAHFQTLLSGLFRSMAQGGPFGVDVIDWFNGGLFDAEDVLPLEPEEIATLAELAHLDWSAIEPSIFGTLFERGLDPSKRSQLGAHYTDPGSIMRLVNPVVVEPLKDEWQKTKEEIQMLLERSRSRVALEAVKRARKTIEKVYDEPRITEELEKIRAAAKPTKEAVVKANTRLQAFLKRLRGFRILDPACGSGNFLYLALGALKDLEHQVMLEAETLGLQRGFPQVGPEAIKGIEINPYAAELARVTVWIGEIQWMLNHGFSLSKDPILKPLETIEERDAVLSSDNTEPQWPKADVIIGNPPFLGDKKMISELGEDYVTRLRNLYKGRVPGGADLVTYWFEKARAQIKHGKDCYAGLVATNSIRGGANRKVLDRIRDAGAIFEAWSDEPWINEGAAVRVSLVAFGAKEHGRPVRLDGEATPAINPDLTAGGVVGVDLTTARRLPENKGACFEGIKKYGAFDITGLQAREWLLSGGNPNERPNADVLRPWINATDVVRNNSDTWVIDFTDYSEIQASLYEEPFAHIQANVKPARAKDRNKRTRETWWRFERARLEMRSACVGFPRYIVTPVVSKHRIFAWRAAPILPMNLLDVIARSDDETFGILHSRFHELWALRKGTSLEDRPRYTPTTTFETFPFPEGLTPNLKPEDYTNPTASAIAEAARELVRLRDNWLNPPEWIKRVPEVVPGYPDRLIPVDDRAAKELKKRTLTNLYNQRPTWLDNAHRALDEAVAAAYGWPADLSEEEILRRLLALNLERSGATD